jgi:hypothetical protein
MKFENNVKADAICVISHNESQVPATKSTASLRVKNKTRRFLLPLPAGCLWAALAVLASANQANAQPETEDLTGSGAQWQQWALSIPTAVNPQLGSDNINPALDYSSEGKCVVGQHGSVWFLAGTFFGGTATRTCSVPERTSLFFPVVNAVQINTPGVCGQVENLSARDLRTLAANFLIGATYSVTLDGHAIYNIRRLQSPVFEVALPEDNVFDAPCSPLNVPAGIYSPAVDDGFYVLLEPLKTGTHTLRIQAANPSQGFALDVTFNLNVVPISQK